MWRRRGPPPGLSSLQRGKQLAEFVVGFDLKAVLGSDIGISIPEISPDPPLRKCYEQQLAPPETFGRRFFFGRIRATIQNKLVHFLSSFRHYQPKA